LRYRGAAMAEFWRALKTLKALQAEQAREAHAPRAAHPLRPAARPRLAHRLRPNEPESGAGHRLDYLPSTSPVPIRAPHEPAAHPRPNEPERRSVSAPEPLIEYLLPDRPAPDALHEPAAARTPNEPERPAWTPNEPESLRPSDDGARADAVRGASGGLRSR
jgi:hypothetical protein